MIKRIVEISNPARLSLKNRQMLIERDGFDKASVPVEDIGVLILEHPSISHTQGVLSACAENNVAVLVCNEKHLPAGVLLSLAGNSLHSKIIGFQAQVSEPTRKRLWQEIVRAKIKEQVKVLETAGEDSHPLPDLVSHVRSGDPDNIEAQSARIYWQRLFGTGFNRDYNQPGINSLLNYGYAVMRAAVARALVGSGLHPSLGIHHHNQYDSFCLADDLLEPLRPTVDLAVYNFCQQASDEPTITPESKRSLLEVLNANSKINDQRYPLLVALHHYAASLCKVICGETKRLEIPAL